MTSKTFIVLDDDGNELKFIANWGTSDGSGWYRGTARTPPSTGSGRFNFTFEGSYVSFLGLQPSAAAITLTDSSSTVNTTTTLQIPSPSNRYIQWYRSPESAPGNYNIIANGVSSGSIDAILVGLDQKTPLLGKTLLVDDDEDSQIVYTGSWTRNSNAFSGRLPSSGWPVQNTTHETSTVGDLLTFRFTGTGLSIYGLFSWDTPSLLTLTYTLDNTTVARSYAVTPSSQEYIDKEGEVPNYLFFSYQNLRPGPHSLVINVTDVRDTSFRMDYLTYQPSFADLSAMPVISADPAAPTDKTPNLGSAASSGEKRTKVGAIVGGVIGGLAVLGLVGFLAWLRWRRKHQTLSSEKANNTMTPFVDGMNIDQGPTQIQVGPNTVTPFSPTSATFNTAPSSSLVNNNTSHGGKGAIIRSHPPAPTTNPKAALFAQREALALSTPSSATPQHLPATPLSHKNRANRSTTVSSVSALASSASASGPSVAPSPHTSKAALGRTAAAANNQGPSPPSYNTIVTTTPRRSKFSLPTLPS